VWFAYLLFALGTAQVGLGLHLFMRDSAWPSPWLYVGLGTLKLLVGGVLFRRTKRLRRTLALQRALDAAFRERSMTWEPTTREEIDARIVEELAECSPDLRAYFNRVRIVPEKWKQSPYGDRGGGFWVGACDEKRVLWWNEIEEGWNVSDYMTHGTIPADQYWCNQDPLKWALPVLSGAPGITAGPPQPLPHWPPPPS